MNKKKPSYDELKEQLAKTEEFLARLQKNEINPIKSERDTAILSTKELAEAYLASEQNFKNSIDTCPLGIRIVTEDGELIYANKAALSIFGYQTVEELAAVKRQELFTPESYAAHQERKKKRKLKQHVPGEYDLNIRRPDGQVRNLQVFRREVMWGGEKQYMAMYEDVTEHKRAEEALRESEEKYHSLIEHSNDGIVFIEDDLINYCNSKMLEMGGYTTEDLCGKPFVDFIVPEQKENVTEINKKRIAGLTVPERYELNLISKGGSIVNAEISTSLFYLRQKPVDIVIVRDITDRKKMDEAFRQSEEMFAKAFRSSPDAVTITTLDDSIIIDTNDAAVRDAGYSINEMIGHSVDEFNLWANPEDHEKMLNLLIKNNKVDKEEYKFRTKSGEIRIWEYSAEPIVIGGRNCIISVQRDITERKQAEEALKESEELLKEAQALGKIGSWKFDVEKQTISWSEETYVLYERDPKKGPPSPEEEAIYYSPEQAKILREYSARAIETGQSFSYDLDVILPSRRKAHYYAIMQPVKDKQGRVTKLSGTVQDITERKQAEEALQKEQTFLSNILNSIPEGLSILDKKLNIIMVPKTTEKMYAHAMPLIGKKCYEVYHSRSEPCEVCPTKQTLQTGKAANEVVRRHGPGGVITGWTELYSSPLLDSQTGEMTGVIEYGHDITERKRMEEQLEADSEEIKLIIDSTPILVFYKDLEGKFLRVNKAFALALNMTEEDMLGKTVFDLYTKDIAQGMADDDHEVYKSGHSKLNIIEQYMSAIGLRWVQTDKIPIFDKDNKVIGLVGFAQDITERKRAGEALKESEERYHLLYEEAPVGYLSTSIDGHVLQANRTMCEMCGYSMGELTGRKIREFFPDKPETQAEIKAMHEKLQAGQESRQESELLHKDGSHVSVDTISRPVMDRAGKLVGVRSIVMDITERKRAGEALKESEERLRSIFSTAPVGIGMVVNRVFTEVNENFCKMVGYTRDELIGQTGHMVYPSDEDYEREGREKNRQLAAKGTGTMESRLRHKDGTVLNVLLSASALDPNDLSRGITFTVLDITERKRAEEAIKESEERFNKAFHASPNMMAVITLEEGRIIDVNAEHTRITGYERREVIGKTALELNLWAHPEKRDEFYKIVKTEGRLKDYEILLRTRSGEIRTLLFSAEKIALRGINCLVVSALDITERKEAEERINLLNLTLRSIRNVSQIITREKDRSLLIQKICDSLVESQSYRSAWIALLDEKRQPVIWAGANVNKVFPKMIELFKQNKMPPCVIKALKQNQVVVTEQHGAMCKDCPLNISAGYTGAGIMTIRLEIEGKTYGVLCTSIPKKLINDKEEMSLFSEIATDIAFALHDIELVAANKLQEQERLRMAKMESIGMLAGGIAHDFNNLLTGIMGNIGLVKTYISPSDPTYEMLNEAEVAAVRAKDLTQQLLTFAKGGKPVKKLVNLAEIIKAFAEFALRGSKAKLELSFPDDLWQIEADEGQINQAINNIVINADEAMPTGGTLKITAENLALKKSDALPVRRGNYVRIDIKDTGIGISPAHLQRIFEPYFTTKKRGSGLGLTTAYSIVKNHGGIILIESVLNEGSTFHIYLPATKKALKGAKKLIADESGQAGGKVLIMDDEEIIRKMLKNMLGLAGYTVELSADGAEALEKYKQAKEARDPFNAVIMDLTIPGGMGGKEAVKKLLEFDPKATVIVSSGYATDPIMSDYKRYGFKAVIAKPYSVKQLRDLLSRLLAKKKRLKTLLYSCLALSVFGRAYIILSGFLPLSN